MLQHRNEIPNISAEPDTWVQEPTAWNAEYKDSSNTEHLNRISVRYNSLSTDAELYFFKITRDKSEHVYPGIIYTGWIQKKKYFFLVIFLVCSRSSIPEN